MPARPAQVYETTIYDRESGQWFSLASAPVRSLSDEDTVSVASYLAGTVGAVVSDYGTMKEVEIADENGVPLDFPVVPVKKLKLVSKHSDRIAADPPIRAKRQKRRKPQRATAARSSVA